MRISFFKKILFISALFFVVEANAATTPAAADFSRLLNNVQTMQADFTQSVIDKSMRQMQQSAGVMSLSRPGKFRWEVMKPNPQLIVSNGKKLWIYDADLEQVTIRLLSKQAGETPALFLSNNNGKLDKRFIVEQLPNRNAMQWYRLTPKDKSSLFSAITFGFLQNEIREMELQDHLGHTTVTHFHHVKINAPIAPEQFTFKLPPEVDVIDETRS